MTNLVKDAETAVSAVVNMQGAAAAVEAAAGVAGKAVGAVAGGLLAGFMPYILGVLGALLLGLAAVVFWDRYVEIPHLRAQAAIDAAALRAANDQTAAANNTIDLLRAAVSGQNERIAELQESAGAAAQLAAAAGRLGALKPLPPPPAQLSAAGVNAYLKTLRSFP